MSARCRIGSVVTAFRCYVNLPAQRFSEKDLLAGDHHQRETLDQRVTMTESWISPEKAVTLSLWYRVRCEPDHLSIEIRCKVKCPSRDGEVDMLKLSGCIRWHS